MIINDASQIDQVNDFLVTPVAGGCIHVPSPPPEYVVHVKMQQHKKVTVPYGPIEVTGVLVFPQEKKDRKYFSFELIGTDVIDYREAQKK